MIRYHLNGIGKIWLCSSFCFPEISETKSISNQNIDIFRQNRNKYVWNAATAADRADEDQKQTDKEKCTALKIYICRIKFSHPYTGTHRVVLLSLEYIRHCSWWKWFIVVRFNVWVAKNRQLIELHGVSMKEFH